MVMVTTLVQIDVHNAFYAFYAFYAWWLIRSRGPLQKVCHGADTYGIYKFADILLDAKARVYVYVWSSRLVYTAVKT
jgi:hypothetical protein